ncbi:MAG: hypothetical protein ACRYFK_06115 [Janthinobacterium lividum]
MLLACALRCGLAGLVLLGAPRVSLAQAPPPAQVALPPVEAALSRLSPWLLKGGLRLTHLSYSRTSTNWRLLMPLSLATEYRVNSRFSLYAQLDTDMQLASTSLRRRRRAAVGAAATLPAAALGLGARCYYGRPAGAATQQPGVPELGKYLALEANATLSQASTRITGATRGFVGSRMLVVPALYALWGVQNRLRPHVLYDLSAGLGVLAPTRTNAEYYLPSHNWDVGAQVNIRLYLAR